MKHRERLAKSARAAGVDSIFVLPRRDLQAVPFPEANMKLMKKAGIDIRYSDWVVPPNLSKGVPVESGGCCGAREFLRNGVHPRLVGPCVEEALPCGTTKDRIEKMK